MVSRAGGFPPLSLSSDAYPKVSIILVGHNTEHYLTRCLVSLMKTNYPNFEIIYVDNGSTDGSVRYFQTYANERGKLMKLDRNYGFTLASNIGARSARGEYLVFLNVDTVVDVPWLDELVSALEKDPAIGAAQPKLLQMNGNRIDSLGAFITPYGTVWSKGYGLPDQEILGTQDIFYAKGAAMITRRDLWETVGGFDPVFHLYYQETDYCWRLWSMGYRVICVADSKVWHVGGAVSQRHPEVVKYYESRERLTLLLKNYSVPRVLTYVPVTVYLHAANALRFLLRGHPKAAANILRGTISAFLHLPETWTRRRDLSADRVAEDEIFTRLIASQTIRI